MADSKNAGKNISKETSMDEMIAWHRLEIKQIQSKVLGMKKESAKGSKAEQEAKRKQLEEDISQLLAKLKEKLFKEFDSKFYNNNNFKEEAKEKSLSSDGEWTEGKQARMNQEEDINPQRQARLKQKMEITMNKVESSEFYNKFLKQLKSPEVSSHFHRILGSEKQLQMVIYGIGSIESDQNPRFQLSIAILMTRDFDWFGNNIEVYDPVLTATECSVIGCTVLSVNEEARREALKPTIFFMPHCPAHLYSNLLEANWRVDRLSNIALLGNSFQMYREKVMNDDQYMIQATKRIIAARRFMIEFAIETVSYDDYYCAFSDLSCHFFSTSVDCELPLTNGCCEKLVVSYFSG